MAGTGILKRSPSESSLTKISLLDQEIWHIKMKNSSCVLNLITEVS